MTNTIARATSRVVAFWNSYFFRPGGAYNIAICRIALFGYFYVHLLDNMRGSFGDGGVAHLNRMNLAAYYPKSLVWFLFPEAPPPAGLIDAVYLLAIMATVAAIIGLFTRIAMVTSVVSLTFLGALIYSWEPLWSHPYNSGLLAGIGMMFGRAGDRVSLDNVIHLKLLRRPINIERDVYWWPVILGLFGTTMVYFGGFYSKLATPEFSFDLSWVLSDNLRNSVLLPWLIRGDALPWNVALLASHPWIWKMVAAGHLLTQALPILALASLKKPVIRVTEGMVFVASVFLLLFTMGFWNPEWIILGAFFVDWEYFASRLTGKRPHSKVFDRASRATRMLVLAYAGAFVMTNMTVILLRLDDYGNRLYPFSSMTFYGSVLANRPYGEHSVFGFNYGQVELRYADGSTQEWHCAPARNSSYIVAMSNRIDIDSVFDERIGAARLLMQAAQKMSSPRTDCAPDRFVQPGATAVDLYASVLQIPPYPGPLEFQVGYRGLVARAEPDRVIAAAAILQDIGNAISFEPHTAGFDAVDVEILFADDPWHNYPTGPLRSLDGEWIEGRFVVSYAELDAVLGKGWWPYVLRVTESDGHAHDFFGGIVYR